jgi:hypothetical protein
MASCELGSRVVEAPWSEVVTVAFRLINCEFTDKAVLYTS